MDTHRTALERAIEEAGSQLALARKLGTSQSNVWTWLKQSKRGAPAEWVLAIEAVTGVSRHELRPDLYPQPERAA